MKKNKVFISYLSLIHYRRSLFELMLESDKYELHIGAARNNPIPNMKNFEIDSERIHYCKNLNFKIKNNVFTVQWGMLRKILKVKPKIVVLLGVNPLIISSLFIFLFLKIFSKSKILWWGHGTLGNQGNFGRKFRLFFYRLSHGIILYGKKVLDQFEDSKIKDLPKFVLGNALNNEDYGYLVYTDLKSLKINNYNKDLKILFSGRITKRKKVELLIQAADFLKKEKGISVKVYVIGEGPEKNSLVELVKKLNMEDDIFFPGEVYGKDIHKYFIDCDIYIVPAALGLSVIHANSFGLPLITSNDFSSHGPEVEMLKKGINGSFYESDSYKSLAEEIMNWNLKIQKNRSEVIENCINSMFEFSPEQMNEKFIKIFDYYN